MLFLLATLAFANPYATYIKGAAMTASDEYALGLAYSSSRAWLVGKYENPEQQLRVERITRDLIAASDRPDMIINVTLLDTPDVNASAYPGGFLLVNRGTLELLDDPQLAFVLGHELSHAILRHGANALNLATAAKTVTQLQSSRAAGDRAAVTQQANDLRTMSATFSRQQEYEADLYGMLYAVRAGWKAESSVAAMNSLKVSFGGDMPAYLAVNAEHPTFTDRIKEMNLGIATIHETLGRFDQGVAFFRAGRTDRAATAFQQFLTLFPNSSAAWANLGACWMREVPSALPYEDILPLHASSGQRVRGDRTVARERAVDALQKALALDPYDPVALGLFGVLALRDGDPASGYELLEEALELAPDSVPLMVDLGVAAAALEKHDEALKHWEAAHALAPTQAEPLVNIARLQESRKKKKQAIAAWNVVAALPGRAQEAAKHLEALGDKKAVAAAAAVAATANKPEALLIGTAQLAVRAPVDDFVKAFGPAVIDEQYDDLRYLAWPGIELVAQNDRVMNCLVQQSGAKTASGIAIGSELAAVTAVWGPPTDSVVVGAYNSQEWSGRGVAVGLIGGRVAELQIFVPE